MSSKFVFKPAPRTSLKVCGIDQLYPVHRIHCVGRNYAAHAREMGLNERAPPFFFSKPADAVTQRPIVSWPPATGNLHHEVELVVALGSGGSDIAREDALHHVYGYAVGVDLTRRDLQASARDKGHPWDTSKGFDESAPLSGIHRTADGCYPEDAEISLSVNGVNRQHGKLSDMLWSVPEVIAELSRYYTLAAGDLIFMGTPEGVAALASGDEVECEIRGIARHVFTMGNGETT